MFTAALIGSGITALAGDTIYSAPSADDARTQFDEWLAERKLDRDDTTERIDELWKAAATQSPSGLLDLCVRSFATADTETRRFVEQLDLTSPPLRAPEFRVLSGEHATTFYRANLGLYFGRFLTKARMYDEAVAVLDEIDPSDTVDPASCLFFKAVCQHQLLLRKQGLQTLEKLMSDTEEVPIRYTSLAELMKYELSSIREESLDEIALMMSDVERRLDLGRGGPRVQGKEEEIIARLNKMIEDLENQASSGSSGAGGGGGSQNQPGNGAADSTVKGSTAPGKVDDKKIAGAGGWGMLDEKSEARARQLIGRDFPAHYRQAIEDYFRKLARQRATASGSAP